MIGMLFLGLVAGYAIGYAVILSKHIRRQRELGKQLDMMIAALKDQRLHVPNAPLERSARSDDTLRGVVGNSESEGGSHV
jgi:uncharacterized membrane-anchored protein YhcB (DUF1043 family)